jgi:hypothetical protein
MITDYKLLEVPNNRELQQEVKRFIAEGWEPFGSPVYVGPMRRHEDRPGSIGSHVRQVYAQAIIKRRPESEELEGLRASIRIVNTVITDGLNGVVTEREALEAMDGVLKRAGMRKE